MPDAPKPSGDTPLEGEDRKEVIGTRAARYPEFDGGLRSDGQNAAGVAQPQFAMQTDANGQIVQADPNKGTGSDGTADLVAGADVLDEQANNKRQQGTQESQEVKAPQRTTTQVPAQVRPTTTLKK